ncbi:MAG: HEAT repeat domain-containing protein [Phycisphaeraceae bacterium]
MSKVLCRPLLAALVCVFAMAWGGPADGQFLPQEIIEAEVITTPMTQRMSDVVNPEMRRLIDGEPKGVSDARRKLLQLLNYETASPEFLDAFSKLITARMDQAVNHDDPLVRMNAMIILSEMVDDRSKPLIDSGLEDDSEAVQHWAMKALGQRMRWWTRRGLEAGSATAARPFNTKVTDAIAQIVKKLEQDPPPHPIVAGAGLESLIVVNTPAARTAVIDVLNNRVALHAANPDMSYAAERAAIEQFVGQLALSTQRDFPSIKGLNRAMYRYAALVIEQARQGQMDEDQRINALSMLLECLLGLARTTAASGKAAPTDQPQARNWIDNGGWVDLKNLVERDWSAILRADPFNLTPKQLEVGKPATAEAE